MRITRRCYMATPLGNRGWTPGWTTTGHLPSHAPAHAPVRIMGDGAAAASRIEYLESENSMLKGKIEAYKADQKCRRCLSWATLCAGIVLGGVGQLLPGTWDAGVPCDILSNRYFMVSLALVTLTLAQLIQICLFTPWRFDPPPAAAPTPAPAPAPAGPPANPASAGPPGYPTTPTYHGDDAWS